MPDAHRLLTLLRQAAILSRATAGRVGHVVHLQDADDVMILGDLHGNMANFALALNKAQLERHPRRHLIVQELIHGTFRYPDGSDKSHQAVDLWAALKCRFPHRVHYLPGNHELAQWTNRPIAKADLDLNASFLDGVRFAYGADGQKIYAAYLDLFRALPWAIRLPHRVFVCHTVPTLRDQQSCDWRRLESAELTDDDAQPGGLIYALTWGRDVSAPTAAAFLQKVDADLLITGHIPCDQGFTSPNDRQLILDSLGSPAAVCLCPADRPLTLTELLTCVHIL